MADQAWYCTAEERHMIARPEDSLLPISKVDLSSPNEVLVYLRALELVETADASVAANVLAEILRDPTVPHPEILIEMVGALGAQGRAAVPTILPFLDSGEWKRRSTAADALGKIGRGAHPAVPRLLAMFKGDKRTEVRCDAAVALARIAPDNNEVVTSLVESIKTNAWTQIGALKAIGEIGPLAKAAVPALCTLLQDNSNRQLVVNALGRIGPAARDSIPSLIDCYKRFPALRGEIAIALSRIGPAEETVIDLLAVGLQDSSWAIRRTSAEALGIAGKPAGRAVRQLVVSLNDKEPLVRVAASLALWRIDGSVLAMPTLLSVMREAMPNKGNATHVTLADHVLISTIKAVGEIGPAAHEAIPLIMELGKDGQWWYCADAAICLGRIGEKAESAIPMLNALSKHGSARVRNAATTARQAILQAAASKDVQKRRSLPKPERL